MAKRTYSAAFAQKVIAPKKRYRKAVFRKKPLNMRSAGFLGLELKFLDCAFNGVTVAASTDGSGGEMAPSSGCTASISAPSQGDGESQRDNRKYTVKSAWVSGVIDTASLQDGSDPQQFGGYYLAMVLDTQTNGAAAGPTSEAVFINPSSSAKAMVPQPLRNLQNAKRFRILASKYIPPGGTQNGNDSATTISTAPMNRVPVNLSWKGSFQVNSVGTTAAAASVSDNAIFLIGYACDSSTSATFTGKSRVRFMG